MKIVVGSQNPIKVLAVREVFEALFDDVEVTGVAVESSDPHHDALRRVTKSRWNGRARKLLAQSRRLAAATAPSKISCFADRDPVLLQHSTPTRGRNQTL